MRVATTAPALRYAGREPVFRCATSAGKISREPYKRAPAWGQRDFSANARGDGNLSYLTIVRGLSRSCEKGRPRVSVHPSESWYQSRITSADDCFRQMLCPCRYFRDFCWVSNFFPSPSVSTNAFVAP